MPDIRKVAATVIAGLLCWTACFGGAALADPSEGAGQDPEEIVVGIIDSLIGIPSLPGKAVVHDGRWISDGPIVEDDFAPDSEEAGAEFFARSQAGVLEPVPQYSTAWGDGFSYQVLDSWEIVDLSIDEVGYVMYLQGEDGTEGSLRVVTIYEEALDQQQEIAEEFVALLRDQLPALSVVAQATRTLDGYPIADVVFSGEQDGVEFGGLVTIGFGSETTVVMTSTFLGGADGGTATAFVQAHRSLTMVY